MLQLTLLCSKEWAEKRIDCVSSGNVAEGAAAARDQKNILAYQFREGPYLAGMVASMAAAMLQSSRAPALEKHLSKSLTHGRQQHCHILQGMPLLGGDGGLDRGCHAVVLQRACQLAVKILDCVLVACHQLQVGHVVAPNCYLLGLQQL